MVEGTKEGMSLEAMSILVVEDQFLIAMDTEQVLRGLGAVDVRLASSVGEALEVLKSFVPDAAVLDFVLADGTSETIAEVLRASQVPFIFATGYSDNIMIPAPFRHVPLVRKPFSKQELGAQLGRLLRP